MFASSSRILPLAALFAVMLAAPAASARAPQQPVVADEAAARAPTDAPRLLAAGGVIVLSLGSLGGVALISRRQRGYLQRR